MKRILEILMKKIIIISLLFAGFHWMLFLLYFITFDIWEITSISSSNYEMIISPFTVIICDDFVLLRNDLHDWKLSKLHFWIKNFALKSETLADIRDTSSYHCPSRLIIMKLWRLKNSDLIFKNSWTPS